MKVTSNFINELCWDFYIKNIFMDTDKKENFEIEILYYIIHFIDYLSEFKFSYRG